MGMRMGRCGNEDGGRCGNEDGRRCGNEDGGPILIPRPPPHPHCFCADTGTDFMKSSGNKGLNAESMRYAASV